MGPELPPKPYVVVSRVKAEDIVSGFAPPDTHVPKPADCEPEQECDLDRRELFPRR